jgi:D-alanyl-D-alanine carboxypeptidase
MPMRVMALLLSAALAAPAAAQQPAPPELPVRLEQAWQQLDAYVAQQMRQSRTPGVALALTTREGTVTVRTYGWADLKEGIPVAPDTHFQSGSISKSFTALALLQLVEEGKLLLDAPLSEYWPWFEVRTAHPAFTIHHLLRHTSGLPRDRDDIPTSLFSAWAVRERETAAPPGVRWAYSNVGYQILGYLLEELDGASYSDSIRRRILGPAGMGDTEPVITHAARHRLAVGYRYAYDDRPPHRTHPLAEAPWFEYGAGDGSIAATPADMAAYLRVLLNRGAAPGGRILSEEAFARFLEPPLGPDEDPGNGYGYGITVEKRDGRTVIYHGGGMVGYSAMLRGELESGLGAVVFVNGPGNPGAVASFALDCLRAALDGADLPPLPPARDPFRVENAEDFAGAYTSPDGRRLTFVAEGERLFVIHRGQRIPLERRGGSQFYALHSDFELFPLVFRRAAGPEPAEDQPRQPGPVHAVTHGPAWFAGERYTGARHFEAPAEWAAYEGHYRTWNPWFSNFRVFVREGRLWLAFPLGGEEPLEPLGDGRFRIGADERSPERIRFDAPVNGHATRANVSGVDFYRSFTP